jgi:hypothetical protein
MLPGVDFHDPAQVAGLNGAFPMEQHNQLMLTLWYFVTTFVPGGCACAAGLAGPDSGSLRRSGGAVRRSALHTRDLPWVRRRSPRQPALSVQRRRLRDAGQDGRPGGSTTSGGSSWAPRPPVLRKRGSSNKRSAPRLGQGRSRMISRC